MQRFLWVLLLLVFTFMLPACTRRDEAKTAREQPKQAAREPASGGTYRRPLGADPATLDPARMSDFYAVTVTNQIFDSLVEFDAQLNVLPELAQSWSASRDSLTWTFNLRKGVQFHNGREMVADDVVYSLSRLLDPAVRSPRSSYLSKVKGAAKFQAGTTKDVEGVKALDRYTVQITLSELFAPFITILGIPHLSIVPREEVERSGPPFAEKPVGTGPFRIVQWDKGREIILEANATYFRGRPALDRVRFVIFPGTAESDMVQAFLQGQLEESPITQEKRKELLEAVEAGTYTYIRRPMLGLLLLGFNREHPPFDKLEIRKAFNYTIDKVHLNREVYGERYGVAQGILPPGMPGYKVQGYRYDLEKAKDLLAQAGHPGGQGLAPVTLASSAQSATIREQEFQTIQRYLATVGIQVEWKQYEDWPTFRQALERGEEQFFRYSWYADYPDPDSFFYPLFHSQSLVNYFRYRNPTVDQRLDDARRETDDLRRAELYREAEKRILDDAAAVMLLHYTYERVFQRYVDGVEVNALGDPYIPMWKIRLTPAEQARVKK